uniref:TALPID3 protein-like n=1 Tax=Saccoglossus kowalevskii TaxID=10224 RepID=A0ABM0MD72_SACKO|nr:PREDICTED: TALPID3 protein-like [Saccoglossus kowalevskii]
MRTVLKGAHKLQTDTEQRLHLAKIHEEVKSDVDRRHEVMAGPAPIDQYLTKPAVSSPITYHAPAKLPSSPALMNAPIIDGCAEAQKTLLKVQASKGYLDTNLDVVAHAATNEELYSLIDRMMYDRDAAEKAYIRAKVDKMIHVMNYEIQDEMLYGKDDKIQVVPQKDKLPDKSSAAKTKGKPGKKKVQAKINTGLRKKRVEEEDDSKENKPQKLPVKKPQKSTSHMQDEQYLSRVYGKALYGPKRKTDKTGPYLRFQSTPVKPGGTRPKVVQEVQAVKMKSSKTQTTPSPKKPKLIKEKTEFYFNPYQHLPTRGTAVPPMPGQLIPMAISLGQPRSGSGLSQPVVISTTRPARDHDVSNVAIVEMQAPEEPRRPQLDIQVLPSVDIDSTPPTPAPSDRVSPPKAQVEEKDDMIDGTGISLPGYDESPSVYHGPPFPPQQPAPQVVAVPSSDVLAEEIGRRDLFENRAIEWVEQELMARIISQMRPREEDEPDILRPDSPVSSEATDESVIVDGMGNAGLQLFVDSGHPVSSDLVNALVREVIEEKLAAMLGQQLADRQRPRSPPPSPRQVVEEQPPRQPTPPPFIPRERVSTPVVTPHASPIHTPPPPAVRSPLDTPDVTPEGSIVMVPESETDSDMREPTPPPEPTPIKMPDSPVQTPISTPPRTPPPKAPTPLPSPRDSPIPSVQEPSPSPSPKPWTEEELPIDEELPSRDREEEPLRPVVLTLEPDIEGGDVIQIPILTPPKRATPPPSSPSDVSSSSPEPSTFTETTDRDISDGEWLLSRSEGQILPKTRLGQDGFRVAFDHQANKPDDSGSSRDSTLHETEDIEADVTQAFSEGEVLGKKIPIHKDPMLALLARLSQQASVVMPSQEANYLHPATQTSEAEISAGEVSWGQRPSYTTVAEKIVYGQSGHLKPEKSRSTARQLQSGSPGEVELTSGDRPLRVSELDSPKSGRSPKSKHSKSPRSPKSPKSPKSLSQKTPSRVIQVGRSESPRSPRASSASRVIRVGGKPASPPPSSRVIHFSGLDDEQPADDMPQGMAQSTNDLEAQTPDQMQLDALILSGYLSQTFSQSDGAISEMDRSKLPSGLTLGGSAPGTLLVTLPSAEESVEDFDISGASFEQQDDSTISDVSEFSAAQL